MEKILDTDRVLILLRHGQSTWNLENRFTGWVDVPLTEQGREEAYNAGKLMVEAGFKPVLYYTSYLKRAIDTLNVAVEAMNREWIPVIKDWRLNERHYGALEGKNKAETAEIYGEEQVKIWRRSYDVRPPQVGDDDPRFPANEEPYVGIPSELLPHGESLEDTVRRVEPIWFDQIIPSMDSHNCVLISAHGNSLRAIVMMLLKLSPEEIVKVEIPNGKPYIFVFDKEGNLKEHFYL